MPPALRLSDLSFVSADAHACPICAHPCTGPVVTGSGNVFINGLNAARKDDKGIHAACCGPNMYTVAEGSGSVFINGKPAARKGDKTSHCGGDGKSIIGSPNVNIGG